MTPDPVRAPWRLPGLVSGLVVALCALLMLKWLAVAGLVALAVAALVGWVWRGGFRALRFEQADGDADVAEDGSGRSAQEMRPRSRTPLRRAPSPHDCSWCGQPGGHRDAEGRPVRPRHVHAAG